MKHFNIALTCATGADVTLEQATELTRRLLEIGQADARETLRSGEGNLEDAEQAVTLSYQAIPDERPALRLRTYVQALQDSASPDGCSEDLTVVSAQALRDLGQFVQSLNTNLSCSLCRG